MVEVHKIYNFLSLYPIDATNQIWFRLAQKSLIRKNYRAIHDDGRRPIAVENLSNSDDRKM